MIVLVIRTVKLTLIKVIASNVMYEKARHLELSPDLVDRLAKFIHDVRGPRHLVVITKPWPCLIDIDTYIKRRLDENVYKARWH